MIYLSTIMSSDIWDLKALYEGANVQRLVASVTIMESLPIREWAKGGELLLTSSRTLPENEQDLLELLHDMQRLSTAALAVKCRETDEHMARVKRLSILAQEWQIPIFLIPPQRTYLSLTNAINRLLSLADEQDTLKEYLMRYLLLSTDPFKDLIVRRCTQSLQLALFQNELQLIQFQIDRESTNAQLSEQKRYSIFLHVCTIYERMKQQHLLHDFLFMHTNTAIYTAVILKASQFSSACIQELKQLIPVYPDLQIGISSVQKAANIAELMKEAEFSVHVGLTLQKLQIILYPKVQLLRIIQELQQQDKTNYFQQTIAPLKEYPFLLDTLIKYFRNNENQKQTCKELFIHVNTLQYRLKKIEALCGLHMNDMQEKINLYVSLLSHMMENWRNDNDND